MQGGRVAPGVVMFAFVRGDTDHLGEVNANSFFEAINLTDQVVNRSGINLGIVLSREVQVGKHNSFRLFQYVNFDFHGRGIIRSQRIVEVRILQALDGSTCHKVAQGLQLRNGDNSTISGSRATGKCGVNCELGIPTCLAFTNSQRENHRRHGVSRRLLDLLAIDRELLRQCLLHP